ncbi:hypothetical protein C8R45DRAFT_1081100 [Mycena sanguinolenta]|nr:hypothetical protein C8R45DRAFT_1081100 [Mycena sanguinolenta]
MKKVLPVRHHMKATVEQYQNCEITPATDKGKEGETSDVEVWSAWTEAEEANVRHWAEKSPPVKTNRFSTSSKKGNIVNKTTEWEWNLECRVPESTSGNGDGTEGGTETTRRVTKRCDRREGRQWKRRETMEEVSVSIEGDETRTGKVEKAREGKEVGRERNFSSAADDPNWRVVKSSKTHRGGAQIEEASRPPDKNENFPNSDKDIN